MDEYKVIVWDKQAQLPYHILFYNDEETAKYVARRMKLHYVDEWAPHGETVYEVRLHKTKKERSNA